MTPIAPVQIAYFVADIEGSALEMAANLGAGPFHIASRIELSAGLHRGRDCRFVHSSAYGQWGNIMLELVQQDEEGPSPFRDLYAEGRSGLHHLAFFVDDLELAIDQQARSGLSLATRAETSSGVEFAFIDGIDRFGHMLEFYERTPVLENFYEFVRQSARGWKGQDPVRFL